MIRKLVLVVALVVTTVFVTPVRANGFDPVAAYLLQYIGEYVAGKLLDEVWDNVSNKPDVRVLDRRLKELEENAAMRSEMREEIRRVREGLNTRVTKEELKKVLMGLQTQLCDIKRRISDLEERVELQEVKLEDIEKS